MRHSAKRLHALAVALVVAGLAAGCGSDEAAPGETAPRLAVRVATAEPGEVKETFEAGGVVQARTTAVVSSRILAPVVRVLVEPGDRVRAGQTLVELDGRDLALNEARARASTRTAEESRRVAAAEHAAAEAALQLARSSHERIDTLHGRGSATAQERDEAVAALQAAEARVASAAAQMAAAEAALASAREATGAAAVTASFASVTAPFDGVVTQKLVEPGNLAAPGTPLVRIEDVGGFRLEVRVDEQRVPAIDVGGHVQVRIGDERATTGTIEEVARAVDADARAFLVKIGLPAGESFRSGSFGRAIFGTGTRTALLVPSAAVVRQGQVASVYVVDDGHARLRMISTGATDGDRTEILAGLAPGEAIVVDPPAGLSDGRAVSVEGGRS